MPDCSHLLTELPETKVCCPYVVLLYDYNGYTVVIKSLDADAFTINDHVDLIQRTGCLE